jgi:uncharacterized membrane protein YqjE
MEGETNRDRDPDTKLEQDICIHIFTVSSAMVGVCLTVIGLIRVVITFGRADTLADDFLAGDALLFLISCLLSYWALRSRSVRRMHRLEKIADGIFILAMIGMGDHLCLDHLYDLYSSPTRRWLKQLFEDPQPIPAQNLFDVSVAESAFDQSAGEVARMRMVR